MALEIIKKRGPFKIKEIWFAPYPYEVKGVAKVIFRDCKGKLDLAGFSQKEFPTLVIDLTKDLGKIWENINKSCRYEIKRAKREGVKVKFNQSFEDFSEMNRSFRREKGLSSPGITAGFIRKYGTLITAEIFGEVIVGNAYLEDENNIRYWIGASKRLEVDKKKTVLIGMANRLIHWRAIKYAKEKGIKEFDLGGYYTEKMGDEQKEKINIFKRAFGGKLTTHYIYQKNYSKPYKVAQRLYQLSKRALKGGF